MEKKDLSPQEEKELLHDNARLFALPREIRNLCTMVKSAQVRVSHITADRSTSTSRPSWYASPNLNVLTQAPEKYDSNLWARNERAVQKAIEAIEAKMAEGRQIVARMCQRKRLFPGSVRPR
jgi:hypothetical protein